MFFLSNYPWIENSNEEPVEMPVSMAGRAHYYVLAVKDEPIRVFAKKTEKCKPEKIFDKKRKQPEYKP